MPKSLDIALQEEPDRFLRYVYNKNPNIKNLPEFTDALFSAFNTPRGESASKHFGEEQIRELFLTKENQDRIQNNLTDKEFKELFDWVEKSESEINRAKPTGEVIKPSQVEVHRIKKESSVKSYRNKKGMIFKSHIRSKGIKWNKEQTEYIKQLKIRKVSNSQIAFKYNKKFSEKRSTSSISSKLYRI